MEKKIFTSLRELSRLEGKVLSNEQYQSVLEFARTSHLSAAWALRLVQFGVVRGLDNDLSSGRPEQKAKAQVYEICFGKACLARGARHIQTALEKQAVIQAADPDARPVKIKTCSCLHRCSKGPVVRLDGILHEKFPIPE